LRAVCLRVLLPQKSLSLSARIEPNGINNHAQLIQIVNRAIESRSVAVPVNPIRKDNYGFPAIDHA